MPPAPLPFWRNKPTAGETLRQDATDRVHRDTVSAKPSVPEYRLRRLINQKLGHRNFSAFVNSRDLNLARRPDTFSPTSCGVELGTRT
jgi:hypothetical protein